MENSSEWNFTTDFELSLVLESEVQIDGFSWIFGSSKTPIFKISNLKPNIFDTFNKYRNKIFHYIHY